MYIREDKTFLSHQDVQLSINDIVEHIKCIDAKVHLIGLARGSFSILHELSNRCNLPYTILKYSRYDKNDKEIQFGYSSEEIQPDDILLIVDDIADSGISIENTINYLNECFSWKPIIDVYTIVGGINKNWNYSININDLSNNWVVFPWENEIIEICKNCNSGEECFKNKDNIHCNIHNKSYNSYHNCSDFN